MKFKKLVKAKDFDSQKEMVDLYIERIYSQMNTIKKEIENAKKSGDLHLDTLKNISGHLSDASSPLYYFIDK